MNKKVSLLVDRLKKVDYLMITASTVICSLISFIYSVLAKKYVPPIEYGIFSTCTLIQTYMNYIQFGVFNSYNRDYPQMIGAKKDKEAAELKNTAITFMWLIYSVTAIVGGCFLWIQYGKHLFDKRYFFGYIVSMVFVLIDTTANFSMYTVRIHGKYNYSALAGIIKTVIAVTLGIIAIRRFGYFGLYIMPVVGALVSIVLYYKGSLDDIKLRINRIVLKTSMITGIPLMINSFIWTIVSSIDKFVILGFMTTEDLGIYSVPLMGFSTMVLIPQSISQVFYNKISIVYGETKDELKLLKYCNRYTMLNSLFTSAVAVAAFYILPIFVSYYMPNYSDGVVPAQILLIGVAIYGTTLLYGNIFSILKWNRELIVNSVLLCIFNTVFSTSLVLLLGRDIENVAIGTSLSYAAYSIMLLYKLAEKMGFSIRKLFYYSYAPVLIAIIPSMILYFTVKSTILAFILSMGIILISFVWFIKKRKGDLVNE
ncbi:oligosaccharide flippase family protein [Lacrimispora sp.]|jgi:O-antigen/teichoic acid export membrane protein|uniref:oligosaccharide flippase family protein n=1 Tax=Lacrimispora sp. TaxID=2719234 RepID=UPI0028A6C68A|nr:oligosaccharide flippase family protein [Lacrimispora sp.]